MARGVLTNSVARKATYIPDAATKAYVKELNNRIVRLVDE